MNLRKSLAAILIGNVIYFLLMPHLPLIAQHEIYNMDLGLLLDFAICVAVWGAITFLGKRIPKRH